MAERERQRGAAAFGISRADIMVLCSDPREISEAVVEQQQTSPTESLCRWCILGLCSVLERVSDVFLLFGLLPRHNS